MQTNFSYPACFAGTLAPPLFAGLHSYLALFSPAQLRLLTHGLGPNSPVFCFKSLRVLPCASVSMSSVLFLSVPWGKLALLSAE